MGRGGKKEREEKRKGEGERRGKRERLIEIEIYLKAWAHMIMVQ